MTRRTELSGVDSEVICSKKAVMYHGKEDFMHRVNRDMKPNGIQKRRHRRNRKGLVKSGKNEYVRGGEKRRGAEVRET